MPPEFLEFQACDIYAIGHARFSHGLTMEFENGENAGVMRVFDDLAAARVGQRQFVVAQLGQSIDGRIATRTGHSHYVNGVEARRVLHRLRAAVDAVVVGAGTAAADDPQLTVRLVQGHDPARVLIDRRRRAGAQLKMLQGHGRRIVFGPGLPDDPAGVECWAHDTAPGSIRDRLAEHGMKTLLVEGGAETIARFMNAKAVDRLVVFVAPLLIGSGRLGMTLDPIDRLDEALRPATEVTVLSDGDVMFDCALHTAPR